MILSEFEDRLSDVPRWVIVRTIQKQSVMDHSARVAIVAPRIATKYFGVTDPAELLVITRWALLHDRPEAFSGDIPTPGKKFWMGMNHDRFYAPKFTEHPLEWSRTNIKPDFIRRVVKAADYFEALVFIAKEESLGNKTLTRILNNVRDNFQEAFPDMDDMVGELMLEAYELGKGLQDPLA